MKPTWLITDPTEPPFPGGSSPKFRLTLAPANLTPSAVPRVTGVPPIATKIFLLAATSCDTRCQWPMVTPASLNGACCARATPPASVDASQNPTIKVLMDGLPAELQFVGGRRSSVNATSLPGCAKAFTLILIERPSANGAATPGGCH